LGVLGFLGLSGFSVLLFVLHLLLVNILRVVSASGYRHIKQNHLNLGVLCDYVFFFFFFSIMLFYASLVIPKISFVTIN
jgi:hypothetical protein